VGKDESDDPTRIGMVDFGWRGIAAFHARATFLANLNRTFYWRKTGDVGPLIVMGPWSDISAALGAAPGFSLEVDFGDLYQGDVNAQMDKDYGSSLFPGDQDEGLYRSDGTSRHSMGLYISYVPGAVFQATNQPGEIVIDPVGEFVKLMVGRSAGVAGGLTNFEVVLTGVSSGVDLGSTALSVLDEWNPVIPDPDDVPDRTLDPRGDLYAKTKHTFLVDTVPHSQRCVAWDQQQGRAMSRNEFLDTCQKLIRTM
jgi:hypothetical protein